MSACQQTLPMSKLLLDRSNTITAALSALLAVFVSQSVGQGKLGCSSAVSQINWELPFCCGSVSFVCCCTTGLIGVLHWAATEWCTTTAYLTSTMRLAQQSQNVQVRLVHGQVQRVLHCNATRLARAMCMMLSRSSSSSMKGMASWLYSWLLLCAPPARPAPALPPLPPPQNPHTCTHALPTRHQHTLPYVCLLLSTPTTPTTEKRAAKSMEPDQAQLKESLTVMRSQRLAAVSNMQQHAKTMVVSSLLALLLADCSTGYIQG